MSDLDRYFDSFGRQLSAAQPRPPRRALALGGGTGVLAAAIAVFTLLLSGGPAPVDAIAAARAALTAQPGELVHLKLAIETPEGPLTFEQWSAEGPRRWRVSMPPRSELSYGEGEQRVAIEGKVEIQRGLTDAHLYARLPTVFGFSGKSPEADLRALLASGKVTDQGEVESGGRMVRRLAGDGLTLDVDPDTFVPLAGSHGVAKFTVERYEKLPITDETAKLLRVTPAPGAKVTVKKHPRAAARRKDRGR